MASIHAIRRAMNHLVYLLKIVLDLLEFITGLQGLPSLQQPMVLHQHLMSWCHGNTIPINMNTLT